jgi:hypothetical protein
MQMVKDILWVSTVSAALVTGLALLAMQAAEMSGQVKPRHAVIRVPGEGE